MTNQEAIAILERKTTIPGDGYTWKQIEEAINVADVALKATQVGSEPLTLDQLREMEGKPAWIVPVNDKDWEPHWAVMDHRIFSAYSKTERGKMYFLYEDSYGDRWIAYAYHPAHIDREAWEPCYVCKSKQCFNCWNDDLSMNTEPCRSCIGNEWRAKYKFCPECGRPMTEEAWAMLEKRLRG